MKWEVDESTGCWNWLLYLDKDGYGTQTVGGKRGQRAHRVAYAKARGPIPEGMTVDHICFNTQCVNPDHLRLLTHAENAGHQRAAFKTHCDSGHEFTRENTYTKAPSQQGRRRCRECNKRAVREYRKRKEARDDS